MIKWFTLVTFILFASCSQTKNEIVKSYKAGFKTIHAIDTSRIYKPKTDTSDYLHYRPIDIDVWYPSDTSATDTTITVHDLLALLEQRANYYSASNIGNGIAGQLAKFFCDGFKCSDSTRLLSFKTNSFKNASAVNGKFPLVIYMTAFNGMSYENFSLFEELSKKGFVVVSISSIGRFPGDMTMKKEDLLEQVNDAIIALNVLKQSSNIDFNKIGIVGYSWGGLAGAILADKISNVHCLISYEGSEFHHYGSAKDENADFNTIRRSKEFKNLHLTIPYLRLESAPSTQPDKVDSVYKFYPNNVNNAQVFTIDSMQHEDFDCFSFVVKKSGNCSINQRYSTALNLAVSFLEDNLKNENHFSKTVAEMNNITKKK
jgi:dienelactone hydrolase family protein